ncbi:MAG: hypothetical protein AB7I30_15360 [Isosphaeraceae bacterium]
MLAKRSPFSRPNRLVLALALVLSPLAGPATAEAQEPGFLGKIFRQGGNPGTTAPSTGLPARLEPFRPAPGLQPPPVEGSTPESSVAPPPSPLELGTRSESGGNPVEGASVSPRLLPQPRVSRPVTDSDPIVTRVTLGRSDDGQTFGMFLQVFADGTVIDSAGVHSLGRESLRGLLGALDSNDLFRVKGHCGGPPTDFVEQVHVTLFERSLGRLRANAFSFSGNSQGCDPSVKRLQDALDQLQARISPTIPGEAPLASPTSVAPAPLPPPIRLNEGP